MLRDYRNSHHWRAPAGTQSPTEGFPSKGDNIMFFIPVLRSAEKQERGTDRRQGSQHTIFRPNVRCP